MKCIKGPGFRPRRPLHLKFNKLLTEVLKMDFCPHYLKGHCSGLNRRDCKYNHDIQTCQLSACSKTKCMKRHPNVCFNFLKNCCTWRKCSYLHRSPVALPDTSEVVMVGAVVSDRAHDGDNSRCYAAERVILEQKQIIDGLVLKMDLMEKNLFQKHEEIAARLSDTVERVVEPLVERVATLEMETESRKKCEANSCSLVSELVEKVDKMSVSVGCLAQDTDGFRSDVEQKIKAIRNRTTQRMTIHTTDMKEKMEICVGMEDRVLVRIGNDFGYLDKRIQDLLESTKELA